MEIFINGRFLTQQMSGVQQFAREICNELLSIGRYKITILVPTKTPLLDNSFNYCIKKIGKFESHLWEQFDLAIFMLKVKNGMLLNLCNTAPLIIKRQCVTIHDLAYKINPKWFNYWFSKFYNLIIPVLVNNCFKIFTVSETVKKEIALHYKVSPEKILVLYNKVSGGLLDAVATNEDFEYLEPKTFYLMVGTENPRKNLEKIASFFTKYETRTLVIIGGKHKSFYNANKKIQGNNIIRLGYITESQLKWLYTNAKAFLNPSYYEGFGIPNLEALALNCIIILSDIDVFKEIFSDSAYYFDTQNEQKLANILYQVENDKEDVESKKIKGNHIFEKFQGKNRALEIINFIKK